MPSRNETDRNVQTLLKEIDRLRLENRRLRLQLEMPQRNDPEAQSSTRELSQEPMEVHSTMVAGVARLK